MKELPEADKHLLIQIFIVFNSIEIKLFLIMSISPKSQKISHYRCGLLNLNYLIFQNISILGLLNSYNTNKY